MGAFRCDHLPQDVPCRETLSGGKQATLWTWWARGGSSGSWAAAQCSGSGGRGSRRAPVANRRRKMRSSMCKCVHPPAGVLQSKRK